VREKRQNDGRTQHLHRVVVFPHAFQLLAHRKVETAEHHVQTRKRDGGFQNTNLIRPEVFRVPLEAVGELDFVLDVQIAVARGGFAKPVAVRACAWEKRVSVFP